jgi:hypothetical protein
MSSIIQFTVGDGGFPDKLIKKASQSPGEFIQRTNAMLQTIQNEVQFHIPRGQHCPGGGKGGTTKSAIRKQLTTMGGEVYADEHTAPWFKWFEDGRGPVKVKQAKALHFCIQGKHIFRKSAGASKGADSMGKGAKTSEPMVRRKADEMGKWLEDLGD